MTFITIKTLRTGKLENSLELRTKLKVNLQIQEVNTVQKLPGK